MTDMLTSSKSPAAYHPIKHQLIYYLGHNPAANPNPPPPAPSPAAPAPSPTPQDLEAQNRNSNAHESEKFIKAQTLSASCEELLGLLLVIVGIIIFKVTPAKKACHQKYLRAALSSIVATGGNILILGWLQFGVALMKDIPRKQPIYTAIRCIALLAVGQLFWALMARLGAMKCEGEQ